MYRKMRRNSLKQEFADYLGEKREAVWQHIDEFRFMNTADIILLNTVANLKFKYQGFGVADMNLRDIIVDAIYIVRQAVMKEDDTNYSGLTKNSGFFSKVQKSIQVLQGVYERPVL